jgi:hypothetical protein
MATVTNPGSPGQQRRTRWIAATVLACALVLAAACGGSDDSATQTGDVGTPTTVAETSGSFDPPANVAAIEGNNIGETVFGDRFEWSIGGVSVTEASGASTDGSVDMVFDTQVYNVFTNPAAPSTATLALQWDDPDTGDTFTVPVQADFEVVPGEATSTGDLQATLSPRDQETFNADMAYLQIGRAGQSPAIVPLGSDVGLVDRLPVPQDTDGWTFLVAADPDAGPDEVPLYDTVTVTEAYVLWVSPEDGRGVPDGSVVLEVFYDVDNEGSSQSCSARGTGGWTLEGPDGDAVVDLGVSERCVSSGQTERRIFTAFVFRTDSVDGDYVLGHTRDGGGEKATGDVTITVTGEGSVSFRDID